VCTWCSMMWIRAGTSCKGQEDAAESQEGKGFSAKRFDERRSDEYTAGARLAALIVSATGHGTNVELIQKVSTKPDGMLTQTSPVNSKTLRHVDTKTGGCGQGLGSKAARDNDRTQDSIACFGQGLWCWDLGLGFSA
jgi:hypothetical protein